MKPKLWASEAAQQVKALAVAAAATEPGNLRLPLKLAVEKTELFSVLWSSLAGFLVRTEQGLPPVAALTVSENNVVSRPGVSERSHLLVSFLFMCMVFCRPLCLYTTCVQSTCKGKKRVSEILGLELQL